MLAISENQIPLAIDNKNDKILHFAAEPTLEKIFRERFSNYTTADLYAKADMKLNLEHIDLPNDSYKLIIANHVLEHVDDEKAAQELSRILVTDGLLVCMVPIIEGWERTYENSSINTDELRWLHFGQGDHVRYYGRDFRDRIGKGRLKLIAEITAQGQHVIDFGLLRGEKVFVFSKQ